MRWLAPWLLLVLACGEVRVDPAAAPARPAPPADAPDLVLITVDTLRADHVGAYGAQLGATPAIDRLAGEGTLFERVFTPAPLTLPAHASMLTGLEPPRHGVRHNAVFQLGGEARTLAEALQEGGWTTGAVVGAFVLASQFGLRQGFDHYDDHFGEQRSGGSGFQERRAADVTDRALRWIAETDRPFFLWVHYYDPHADYRPPAPWAARFAEAPYAGEIAYTDAEIGRLLETLRARGRWDRTVVALTSDHGEGLGEHGESTHGYFLYDSVLRVPLLLRGPGVAAGARRDRPVSTTALAATLAGLAEAPPLHAAAAASLLAEAGSPPSPLYAETLAPELDFGWAPLSAARGEGFAYIHGPRPELYDVRSDPRQARDLLAGKPSAEAGAARERLARRIEAVQAKAIPRARVELDAETAQRIQALGYLVTPEPPERTGMNPKDGQRWIELSSTASTAYFGHRFDEAERHASEVLAAFPDSVRMHEILARIGLATGRTEAALAHTGALVRLHDANAEYHAMRGRALRRAGRLAEAAAAFETGIARDPDHFGAQLGAMWKGALGSPLEEIEAHAERAVELAGGGPSILEQVGETWEGLGEFDRALACYERGLEQDPHSERLHMRMAIQHARRGDREASEAHRRRAGAAAQQPGLVNRLGIALAARGDHAQAEAIFRGLLARHPDDRLAQLNLARVLEESGRAGAP